MGPWESPRPCGGWTLGEGVCWLLLLPVLLLLVARPARLAAFPTSLSDCQTPTGWNCSGESRRPGPEPCTPRRARASPAQTGRTWRAPSPPLLRPGPRTPDPGDARPAPGGAGGAVPGRGEGGGAEGGGAQVWDPEHPCA